VAIVDEPILNSTVSESTRPTNSFGFPGAL